MRTSTLIAMVTIGPDNWTRRFSVRRAKAYAEKHGYDFEQIIEPAIPSGERTPHWEKTLIPRARPNYERYLVIDDDVLINHRIAPPIPEVGDAVIGLVREPLPDINLGPVQWVANSGVMVIPRASCDLLEAAYDLGEITEIVPGFGEQPAINKIAWGQNRISRLEWKWNYILMADWLITTHGQEYPWKAGPLLGRVAKLTLLTRLVWEHLSKHSNGQNVMERLRNSYFVHLIAFRFGASVVDSLMDLHA